MDCGEPGLRVIVSDAPRQGARASGHREARFPARFRTASGCFRKICSLPELRPTRISVWIRSYAIAKTSPDANSDDHRRQYQPAPAWTSASIGPATSLHAVGFGAIEMSSAAPFV